MQPLDRQFLPKKNRHTSPATSGELDPLLQYEPEDPGVHRREHAAMSVRPSSLSPSVRGEPAARQQRKIALPPVPRSKARRPLWTVVVSATCGSVLVAVILVQITAPSPMASPKPVVPPPPAPTPVQTAAPVANDKKPVAPVRVEPRSRGIDAPVPPSSTASRPVAGTRFYGSWRSTPSQWARVCSSTASRWVSRPSCWPKSPSARAPSASKPTIMRHGPRRFVLSRVSRPISARRCLHLDSTQSSGTARRATSIGDDDSPAKARDSIPSQTCPRFARGMPSASTTILSQRR